MGVAGFLIVSFAAVRGIAAVRAPTSQSNYDACVFSPNTTGSATTTTGSIGTTGSDNATTSTRRGGREQPVTLWQNSIYGYRFWELQVPKVTLIYFKTGFACHFQDVNLLHSLAYPRLDDPAHALEDFFGLCIRTEKRLVHSWHS